MLTLLYCWNTRYLSLLLVIVTLVGKLLLSGAGVLLSGQNLNTSMHCGFSLAQIGEFSFIIASLGMSLGVISDFLYPIIVAVSVMTTFTTPFFVMAAEPAYQFTKKLLPQRTLEWLDRYTEENPDNDGKDSDWRDFLREYFIRILIFTTMLYSCRFKALNYYLNSLTCQEKLSKRPYSNLTDQRC